MFEQWCSGISGPRPPVDAIIFAPPYIINEQEVEDLVRIFVDATKQVLERNKSKYRHT